MNTMLWLAVALTQAGADWPVKTKLQMPEEHGGMFVLALSPDAKTVAGGTGIVKMTVGAKTSVTGGEILLWDPATGKIRKILGKHGAAPSWLAFSRDGKTLGSLSKDDAEFKLWDPASGKPVQSIKLAAGTDADAPSIAFDGRILVTVERKSITTGEEGFSYLFPGALSARDAKTGKTLWTLNDSGVIVMGLSPDGKTLAVFAQKQALEGKKVKILDRAVKLLDAQTGKELRSLDRGDLGYAGNIGFSQDGRTIYAYHDGELHRWDAQEGKPQPMVTLESWKNTSTCAFSADGKVMALVDFMGERAGLVDAASGKTLVEIATKFPASLGHPAFSSDLKLLLCTRNFETLLLGVPAPK
jgi:WD40 repeat protein